MFSIGDKVYVRDDEQHVGEIVGFKDDKAYVRWHKGYAKWYKLDTLVIKDPAPFKDD